MSDTTEPTINIDILFGHVKIESRMRRDGNLIIGEGRALHYNREGVLTKDTGWQPSGVTLEVWDEWPDQPRSPWWKFW